MSSPPALDLNQDRLLLETIHDLVLTNPRKAFKL